MTRPMRKRYAPDELGAALATDLADRSSLVVAFIVDWTHGAQHMWDNHKVEANEAVNDVDAVWFDPDPSSRSSRSVRVIGYSHSRQATLTVILVHRREGAYYGANGWESNPTEQRRYREGH